MLEILYFPVLDRSSDSEETFAYESDNDDTSVFDKSESDSDFQCSTSESTLLYSDQDTTNNSSCYSSNIDESGLSIYYTNADNLINKIDELRIRAYSKSFDILIITEVYPKNINSSSICVSELNILGYKCYRSNVSDSSRGVVIYVKDHLPSNMRKDLSDYEFLESIWIDIEFDPCNRYLFGGIYRSPNSSGENTMRLLSLLDSLSKEKYTHKIILGDFNFPGINWESWTTAGSEEHIEFKFMECLRDNFLEQPVTHPTRWRGSEPGNVLDLVLIDNVSLISNLEITSRLGCSDHLSIELFLEDTCTNNTPQRIKRNFYKGNYVLAKDMLNNVQWSEMSNMNLHDSCNFFYNEIYNVIEQTIPETQIAKKRPKPMWMDNYCCKIVEKKYRAWKKYSYSRRREDYLSYCQIRNKVPRCIKFAKRKFERGVAMDSKVNPKSFWKFVRSKTQVRSGIGNLRDDKENIITDDRAKAEIFNAFFSSVFTVEDDLVPKFDSHMDTGVCDIVVTVDKVRQLLKNIDCSKSTGPDDVHPKFLKELFSELALPICILFNKSLHEGNLPLVWKTANVTCIFKSGDKTLPCNYRPISLTPVLCRLLEKIIRGSIMSHCIDNKIFTDSQFGFRDRRGCILQLLEVFDDWTLALDKGFSVDTIYLDFQKAFDSVPYNRLLVKLEAYGVTGNILKWIKNFLSDRQQRVMINGIASEWTEVTSGVPQGSVLGPLLFILYINDLPDIVKTHCKLFADDAKIYKEINNIEDFEDIQCDLYKLCQWTAKWLLFFNIRKCKVMHIGSSNPGFEYKLKDKTGKEVLIQEVDKEKDLGIIFQSNLKFNEHINVAANKANQIVGLIKRSFTYLDNSTFLTLYKSLIRSHVDYGNSVWFPVLKKDIKIIENTQRRATRILPELQHLCYENRLRALNLPTLLYRRKRGDLIQVFKILNGIDDISPDKFFLMSETTTRGHSKKLYKLRSRKSVRYNSFAVRVIDNWNSLPEEIISSKTVLQFKSRLDDYWRDERFDTSDIY